MGGGDWHKLNNLYTNEEYVEATRQELRRFGGRMDRREYILFGFIAAVMLFVAANILLRVFG